MIGMLKGCFRRGAALFYRRKLEKAVACLEKASRDQLRAEDFLLDLVRRTGLRFDPRGLYGHEARHMNWHGPGLWQMPTQFVPCLVALSHLELRSFVEIGTCDGWTAVFMTAYLRRFVRQLDAVTIDVQDQFRLQQLARRVGLRFLAGKTSDHLAGQSFDLCFIDGDHSFAWIARDYRNLGRHARVCMFHDIADQLVGDENVPAFWRKLQDDERVSAGFCEFLDHPGGAPVMGIGLRIRDADNLMRASAPEPP